MLIVVAYEDRLTIERTAQTMSLTRRKLILASALGTFGMGCSTGNSVLPLVKRSSNRQYVINGNMVIPPNFGDQLDDATKAQLRSTGLTAFKLSLGGSQGSYEQAHEILDSLSELYESNPDVFMLINSGADLEQAYDSKRIGVIYSFEAATMIDGDIERIEEFAKRGVRIMQPGYNHSNVFGAGVMSTTGPLGLTKLGGDAIESMQASDVLVDLSHAHEQTASDVLSVSTRPVAMTHTGCDAINPHQRNKSDALLKSIAESGGVVGIYEMSYLTADLEQQSLDAFMAHILHAVSICGEDHVGIGSDTPILGFDVGPENMAQWNAINKMREETGIAAPGEGPPPYVVGLNGPHKMAKIAEHLSERGLGANAIDKIMGVNFGRVFAEAW